MDQITTSIPEIPMDEVNRLLGERITEFRRRGLNFGDIGPLHPRAMLRLLDYMLEMYK